jgi:hypothetical protein
MIAGFVLGAFLLICAARAGSGETYKAGQSFKDCPDPEMVVVPGSNLTMGSPESEPQRENSKAGIESPAACRRSCSSAFCGNGHAEECYARSIKMTASGPGRVKTLYRSLGRVARGRLLPEWPF